MRSAVRTRLLGEAPYVRHANFTTLGTQDLRLLFRLYDEIFFTDQLQPMVMQHCGRPLQFRVSRAMTSAGGKTIWSKVRGKTISFEIAISTSLLFNSFRDDARPIHVSGQLCSDRVDALMRVMEHEIVHLLEMLTFGKSSCSQTRFLTIAGRLFGHTHPRHGLVTARENAHRQHDIRVGQQVSFRFQGRELTGIQLCRWLLLSLDRLPGNELTMTQDLIANMLGVRREGVTEAAGKLQKIGVIEYSRGHITVLDRPRLEMLTCECYAVVKAETDHSALTAISFLHPAD